MTSPAAAAVPAARKGPGFPEFVALIAMMMALNALAIDAMLPALPAIGDALQVASENSRQWIITAYLLGFGVAQLIYGPLADRYGRKPILMIGLSLYVLFSVLAAFAPSFELLIAARVGTGLGAASLRVLAVSIVRDRYSGRTMARVMSLSFLVFLGVPIIAPTLGQLVLTVAPWPWIFGVLAVAGGAFMIWAALRLPETLHVENRMPIRVGRIASAFREAVSNRQAIGYTLAMTCITGALFGFINSSQQIFFDVFEAPGLFTTVFAMVAGGIAVASLLNARLVERLGSRLISHAALLGFIVMATIHSAVNLAGLETIWTFALLQGLTMFCFGLIAGNFGSMAMEPMGHIAGTASSAQGFISTTAGSTLGFLIGQQFNGSATPMALGMATMGLAALGFVLIAERGRLFKARHLEPPPVTT
ncbi:multidrug effflux MFS transporter [Roseibacterium beibuensis]|uniref:multidrug effflux MFS transporter n=1 Tax=[Roseibacterium] beibuensis TaxID=1193142 RepID=UPI00217E0A36|nr:multidrug effflux MFS transporter [Roseibacterium beibuensis]MCS6627432.1 multidrug effflux MFS transporter [Roseibacterium beibuensis]